MLPTKEGYVPYNKYIIHNSLLQYKLIINYNVCVYVFTCTLVLLLILLCILFSFSEKDSQMVDY